MGQQRQPRRQRSRQALGQAMEQAGRQSLECLGCKQVCWSARRMANREQLSCCTPDWLAQRVGVRHDRCSYVHYYLLSYGSHQRRCGRHLPCHPDIDNHCFWQHRCHHDHDDPNPCHQQLQQWGVRFRIWLVERRLRRRQFCIWLLLWLVERRLRRQQFCIWLLQQRL